MTRRIYSVTPIHVAGEELERRRRRYARITPPGLKVHLDDVGTDAPNRLENDHDVRRSKTAVRAALDRHEANCDYLLPDCVLDPGVPEGRRTSDGPVCNGMLALAAEHLHRQGHRFAAITRNAAIADELQRKVHAYGFGDTFAGVSVLHLDVDSIAEGDRWNEAMRGALDELAEHGVSAVLNGCSAVDVHTTDQVLLVDPAETALRLIAAGAAR